MRLLLIFYVIAFLVLNLCIDNYAVFLLALTTFPVAVYLLVTNTRSRE